MEITWYGQACFRIRDRAGSVVTDPYDSSIGLALPRLSATIVTVSHDHPDHNHVRGLRGSPYVIAGPGEYEVSGIFVIGVPTFHDVHEGRDLGRNTAYLLEFDDFTVCHLGDLGHAPSQEDVEQLGDVDVLLVPVGGRGTLTGGKAAEVVGMLEPRIVIPMHYKVPAVDANLDSATRFLREMGAENPQPLESLKITKSELPDETRVIVLDVKQ